MNNILDFFDKNKPCPSFIENCTQLRFEYFNALNSLIQINCKDCDIIFLKNHYLNKIKSNQSKNKLKIKKIKSKNNKAYNLNLFMYTPDCSIYFFKNYIIKVKPKYTRVFKKIISISFQKFLFLIYKNDKNKIKFSLIFNKKQL
jgi:hypothetical protein